MAALRQRTEDLHRDLHPRIMWGARSVEGVQAHLRRYVEHRNRGKPRARFGIGCVQHGRVLAYALYSTFGHADDDTMRARHGIYVHDITVDPDHRRRGLAKALLADISARARRTGLPAQVHAVVWAGNEESRKLFENAGYAPLHTSYALFLEDDDGA